MGLQSKNKEISIKYLVSKRDSDALVIGRFNGMYSLRYVSVADITRAISGYPEMWSRYHLPMYHDVVAKTIYNAIRKND